MGCVSLQRSTQASRCTVIEVRPTRTRSACTETRSPTSTVFRKFIASIATVTVRDFATFRANTPPPRSIWLSSQPPKISPCALVSAGIASVRMQRSEERRVDLGGRRIIKKKKQKKENKYKNI